MSNMTTIALALRGGGPDFPSSALFEMQVNGRIVADYASPDEVREIATAVMRAISGHDRATRDAVTAADTHVRSTRVAV